MATGGDYADEKSGNNAIAEMQGRVGRSFGIAAELFA